MRHVLATALGGALPAGAMASCASLAGLDQDYVVGEPGFVDAAAGDFRVSPGGAAESYGWPGSTVPPTVAITQPAHDSDHPPGTDIVLQATAADSDGSVSAVEYFWGRVLLGSAREPPFAVTWSGVPAGVHRIRAVATDNHRRVSHSAPVRLRGGVAAADTSFTASEDAHCTWAAWGDSCADGRELSVNHTQDRESRSYLKFVVSGLTQAPAQVWLRLNLRDPIMRSGRYQLYESADTGWTADGLHPASAPAATGQVAEFAGAVRAEGVVEFDVTTAVRSDGTYTFIVQTQELAAHPLSLASTEAGFGPALEVVY